MLEKRFKVKITKILLAQATAIKKAFLKHMKEKKDDSDISEEDAEKLANEITIAISYSLDNMQLSMFEDLQPLWINAGIQGNRFFNLIQYGVDVDNIKPSNTQPILIPQNTPALPTGKPTPTENPSGTVPPNKSPKVPTGGTLPPKEPSNTTIEFLDSEGNIIPIIRQDYLDWLEKYGATKVTQVNDTTKGLTRRIIKEGLRRGDSTSQITEELASQIVDYTKQRAVLIAETETHNSFQKGNFLSALDSGFKYKTWITAGDGHVRDSHKALNNKRVKINEDFKAGLGHPGDSRAPGNETIRCRCVLFYE